MTAEERAEHEFVRRWNALMLERDAEERERWPLRREDRAKAPVSAEAAS